MDMAVFKQFELQFPDMANCVEYFLTRLHVEAAIIRQSIELSNDFVTSAIHVLSAG